MSSARTAGPPCMAETEAHLIRIAGPLRTEDVPRLCEQVAAARHGPGTDVICDVTAMTTSDLSAVEAIARMQLAARRAGRRVRLRNPAPALLALLGLVGLTELLGLVVEMEGHPEEGEPPLGVQEAVEAGDTAL
ncbi:STAS domain-containing protein OS=Streptomyces alboniger OX=132473 GN=CP975_21940 PE=4 SV=1 [Streptomyces alboniger]